MGEIGRKKPVKLKKNELCLLRIGVRRKNQVFGGFSSEPFEICTKRQNRQSHSFVSRQHKLAIFQIEKFALKVMTSSPYVF